MLFSKNVPYFCRLCSWFWLVWGLWHFIVKKCLFPLDACMVSCPSWSKNLERTLPGILSCQYFDKSRLASSNIAFYNHGVRHSRFTSVDLFFLLTQGEVFPFLWSKLNWCFLEIKFCRFFFKLWWFTAVFSLSLAVLNKSETLVKHVKNS